jgi:hypothetical protein
MAQTLYFAKGEYKVVTSFMMEVKTNTHAENSNKN